MLSHKADPEVQTDTIFIKSPVSGISEKYGFIEILLGSAMGVRYYTTVRFAATNSLRAITGVGYKCERVSKIFLSMIRRKIFFAGLMLADKA